MSAANEMTAELLIEIPERFPNIRIWRNNRIKAMAVGRGGKQRLVSAGVDGQADLSGILGPTGRRLEIEVKAGRDELFTAQINFGRMIRDHGGVYLIARNVEALLSELEGIVNAK
ncbi:MAG: hypothetical protein JOZ62_07440 [Acidobacteriaceae bacterium]|nr:hypothetical protein [Acidobacteriaceae bacterium]